MIGSSVLSLVHGYLTGGRMEANYPQFVHGVPWMAKEPSTEIPIDYSGTTYNLPWDQLIHKHVRITDNVEVGYVEPIGNEFVVVSEGVSDVHIYYVRKAPYATTTAASSG